MNWLKSFVKPKIKSILNKREVKENLWISCPETGELVFHKELEENLYVVPNSGYHFRIPAKKRLEHFYDRGEYKIIEAKEVITDPLKFKDEKKYSDRLKESREKTDLNDCVIITEGELDRMEVVVAVQDFDFMGGSLGMAAGEHIIASMERALEKQCPYIVFTSSGGARMQEGILSLMQMPRTTILVQKLHEAKLPYIVTLTNPTTGGVSASYAMLGDVHIAEPQALICFAGPRVISQTIREKLPDGFQKSEYLLEHGMLDCVMERKKIRPAISNIIKIMMHSRKQSQNSVATL